MDNVLLDLGGVLVGADSRLALQAFSTSAGCSLDVARAAVFGSGIADHFELGKIDPSQFRVAICRALDIALPPEQLDATWCRTLYPHDKIVGLVERLAARHKLYLLSNTNSIHFEAVLSMYPWLSKFFFGFHLSYEIGVAKPATAYFTSALERFQLSEDTCIFLDDSRENVLAARAVGIRAHTVTASCLTAGALEDWGLLS